MEVVYIGDMYKLTIGKKYMVIDLKVCDNNEIIYKIYNDDNTSTESKIMFVYSKCFKTINEYRNLQIDKII